MTLALIATIYPCSLDTAPSSAQETDPDESVSIVENFLLARHMGDFSGAVTSCASLLELQDIDESWFVDHAILADWLQRLSQQYFIDTLEQPRVDGKGVTWTERLTRRDVPDTDASQVRMTVVVHAVLRGNKITRLSGPYPPLPLRTLSAAPGEPTYVTQSNPARRVSPVVLFLGSSVGLALLVSLVFVVGRAMSGSRRNESKR